MTEQIEIELRDYEESLAADIATMWNTWDELWPGGFTQGVPYTADRVHKQFGKSDALAILIAIDNESKKPVGSCTLFKHWRDSEAAYIGTLGVSPEALGKKVGKRLLLESINRASQKGYTRVDLNTWAGNMKAVPLYKKIGMMWNPELGGVHMEDYIPGILKHPLSNPFFKPLKESHEWYNVHVRKPEQAPDEYEIDGLAIYPYEFQNGKNSLSVVIDRYGRGISSIDRTIDSSRIKFRSRVDSHQVLCGLPYTYTLEVVNESDDDLEFSAQLEAFEGMIFDDKSSLSKIVPAGNRMEWSVRFHLESSAPLFRNEFKAPTIITHIEVDGNSSDLITGLKVRPAAEIRTRWGLARIKAGGHTEIPLTVISNLSTKATARVHLKTQESQIKASCLNGEIRLPSDGFGGTILKVTADPELEEGVHDIWISLEIDTKAGLSVTTREFRVPVFCLGMRGVAVGRDDRERRLLITSPIYTASIAEEGAILRTNNNYSSAEASMQVRASIGPPFGINPFRFAERTASVETLDTETVVTMSASHPDRPLDIKERARFEHGTGIILHEVWVTNTSTESETFQLRLTGRGGDITFAEGKMFVPLATGVLEAKLGNFYSGYPAIPSDPSGFAEGWIANEQQGFVTGQLWDHSKVEEVRIGLGQIGMISYPLVTLEPKEERCLSQLWFVYGSQNWQQVETSWRSKIGGYYQNEPKAIRRETPKGLVNIEAEPIVLPHISNVDTKITLTKSTVVPLEGRLTLTVPKLWNASLYPEGIESNSANSSEASVDVQLMQDATFDLKLIPGPKQPDGFSIQRALLELKTVWTVKKPVTIIQLGSSEGEVVVSEEIDQNMKVFRVENGLISYTVSPDYGGCLISLKNKNGVEFMTSSFPTAAPKPGGFFDNYFGGVQPTIFDEEMGEEFSKARTNREKMSGRKVESEHWSGVEVTWVGKLQKLARGVSFKLQYLTTPQSPLVLIQWFIKNKTSSPLRFWPTLLVDPENTKQLANGSFQTDWDGNDVELKPGMVPVAVTPSRSLVWLKPNEKKGKTTGFGFMVGGSDSHTLAINLGESLILGAVDMMTWLMPGEEKVIRASLLVDPQSFDDLKYLQETIDRLGG
ncbi:MAG: GNAT family N-acetyltransferase [Candidatus Thorarchaeota archaeon]